MVAPSPVELATTIVNHAVTVNGSPLETTIQIVSIDIWHGVDKLPRCRLVVSDGSPADATFAISESAELIPGVALTISLGYGSAQTQVFSGIIHRQGLEFAANTPPRLVVEASDKAMAMTLARQNAVFEQITDSDLFSKLISANGLTANVTATSVSHAVIVQYYATSWDLLVIRAQINGMVVTVDGGAVTVAPPDTSSDPVLTLGYGASILDFHANIDAATQFAPSAIQSFAWNAGTQALTVSGSASASVTTPGNLSSATLAKVFDVSNYRQQSGGALVSAELTGWSSAELLRAQLSKVCGQVRFQGSALVKPGNMVTLAGLGDRFNGNAWVSAVHHSLLAGLWRTTIDIGMAPQPFASRAASVAAPGASGQLPPVNNLQTGIVKQIDSDPDGEYRVLVTLPLLEAGTNAGVWARFGSFYASDGIGSNFYPEIGDEVILAFLNGDPRYPVILGSLYSKAKPPPYPPLAGGNSAPNNIKSFMTKSKLHIDFTEDQMEILLATPNKQSIVINDTNKNIIVTDRNGNTITLNEEGITLDSPKDIQVTAGGSISLTAGKDITLTATEAFSATGTASVSITSDGITKIVGSMVNLNP